jgi:hypothetical protein
MAIIFIHWPMRSFELFGVVGSITHLPEKKQPQPAGQEDHYARIEDRKVPDFALEVVLEEEIPHDERQGHRRNNADHPCREKTADYVDRGRSVAACAQ